MAKKEDDRYNEYEQSESNTKKCEFVQKNMKKYGELCLNLSTPINLWLDYTI